MNMMKEQVIDYRIVPGIPESIIPFEQQVLISICSLYNKVAIQEKGYGVTPEDVKAKTRKQYIKEARQLTCFFLKKHTKTSLDKIGDIIGGKDHATVLHSVRVINSLTSPYQLLIPADEFELMTNTFDLLASVKVN